MNPRVRRAGIAAAILIVLVIAFGTWGLLARQEPQQATVPEHLSADELADRACDYVTGELPRQVRDDAPAREVFEDLEQAEVEARVAADRDIAFVGLASGISALRRSLEVDDPGSTDVALRVVRSRCGPSS